jgi:hypothetical protein
VRDPRCHNCSLDPVMPAGKLVRLPDHA